LAFGGSWHIDARNAINVSYQHAFRKSVDGSGSIPPAFGGGEVNLSLEENVVGVGYSYQLGVQDGS
jgi:long-chain fatty acid transport protein